MLFNTNRLHTDTDTHDRPHMKSTYWHAQYMAYIVHSLTHTTHGIHCPLRHTQQTAHTIHSQNMTHMGHSLTCNRWYTLSTHSHTANGTHGPLPDTTDSTHDPLIDTHDRWHTSQGNHVCHTMWKTHLWKWPWNSTYRNKTWFISVCLKQIEQLRTLGRCFSFLCKNILKAEKFVVPLVWEIIWSVKQILKANIYVKCVGRLW
jgi:hypothetical protein